MSPTARQAAIALLSLLIGAHVGRAFAEAKAEPNAAPRGECEPSWVLECAKCRPLAECKRDFRQLACPEWGQ